MITNGLSYWADGGTIYGDANKWGKAVYTLEATIQFRSLN